MKAFSLAAARQNTFVLLNKLIGRNFLRRKNELQKSICVPVLNVQETTVVEVDSHQKFNHDF